MATPSRARQMVRLAACKLDGGAPDAATYCAMAKRFATDMGFQICLDAQQIHGGYGYLRDYPLGVWCAILAYIRFWRGRMRSCA